MDNTLANYNVHYHCACVCVMRCTTEDEAGGPALYTRQLVKEAQ